MTRLTPQEVGLLQQTRSYLNAVMQAAQLVNDNYEKLDREPPEILDIEQLQNLAEDLDAEIEEAQRQPELPADEPDDAG